MCGCVCVYRSRKVALAVEGESIPHDQCSGGVRGGRNEEEKTTRCEKRGMRRERDKRKRDD